MHLAQLNAAMTSLQVSETNIAKLISALEECQQGLDAEDFATQAAVRIPSFGAAETGATLGAHHDRAQQVMAETLRGVLADLAAFSDGVRLSARLINDADDQTAENLSLQRAAVEQIEHVADRSQGDQAYDQARNSSAMTAEGS